MGPTVFPFWRLSPRSIPVQSTTTTTTTTTAAAAAAAAAAVTLGPFHRPPLAVLSLFVCLAFVSAFSIRLELWCSVFSVWWCWLRFYRFVFVSRFIFRWFFLHWFGYYVVDFLFYLGNIGSSVLCCSDGICWVWCRRVCVRWPSCWNGLSRPFSGFIFSCLLCFALVS